ncbi:MAG: XTP/dITP diphosphatase [Thermoproteus sp.]
MKIFFATSNPNKVVEARSVLRRYSIDVEQKKVKKLEIQADDVEAIAEAAASRLCQEGEDLIVVEDDGLYIKALNGFPGPYSEYVYRTLGLSGVLKLLEGVVDRGAVFKSAVAICIGGSVKVFTGLVEGYISDRPRGLGGFGFDPIFIPKGYVKTFAELGVDEKSSISHRAKAFTALAEWLKTYK